MSSQSYTLKQLSLLLDAELKGDGEVVIDSLSSPLTATAEQICFLSDDKYRRQIENTQAGAVILQAKNLDLCPTSALVVKDPYLAFAKCSVLFDDTPQTTAGIHPSAVIDSTAIIGKDVSIAANVVIEARASVADNAIIGAGCYIGHDAVVGQGTRLHPNATLYHKTIVGSVCTIHSGAVIGGDGFGFAPTKQGWQRIAQLGRVVIGDNVSVGSNSTIDRGALDDTLIGNDVIIDNLVHIGHNTTVGDLTAIAGCSGIAGSVNIGKRCIIAGGVGVSGHLDIADGVHISGRTVVSKSIKSSGSYSSGSPMLETGLWRRSAVRVGQLDKLFDRVKQLEKRLSDKN